MFDTQKIENTYLNYDQDESKLLKNYQLNNL